MNLFILLMVWGLLCFILGFLVAQIPFEKEESWRRTPKEIMDDLKAIKKEMENDPRLK